MTDPTERVEALLSEAMQLIAEAEGRRPGKYALIAKMTVDRDGQFMLDWGRYGPDPQDPAP